MWHEHKRQCAGCLSGGGNIRELAARAPYRAGYYLSTRYETVLYRQKHFLFRRKTVVRRATCDLQHTAGIRVARAQALLCWLSLGKWPNTRPRRTRASCRAGCNRSTHYENTLYDREASHPQCNTVVRRASCDLQRAAGIRIAREQAPLRWLSLGRWQKTRACRALAPRCAGCDWTTGYGRALHRRKATLFRCKTEVRRESCDLIRLAGIRMAREQAPLCCLSLGMWQNMQACHARAVPRWL